MLRTEEIWAALQFNADLLTELFHLVPCFAYLHLSAVALPFVLRLEYLLMHAGIGFAVQLQFAEDAAGLVSHVDEHGEDLFHDQ